MQDEIWFEENGHRRKGKKLNCLFCAVEFIARLNDNSKKYCSVACRSNAHQKKIEVECANCHSKFQKTFSKTLASKSGLFFCTRICKDKAQKIGGIREIMPPHYGTSEGRQLTKRFIDDAINPKCVGCGEEKRYLLCVHHKDGNNENNVLENFEIVCFNCHIKRHLKFVENHWIYCTKSLTPRDMLDKV